MSYNYDEQIERLTKHPERIGGEWSDAIGLFQFLSNTKEGLYHRVAGCPTLVRGNNDYIVINNEIDSELTLQLRNDERIPEKMGLIKPKHFPAFKEWQEKMDALGREA